MADLELLRESKQPQMGELIEAMVQCHFLTTIWNEKKNRNTDLYCDLGQVERAM